jgi:hypothetical protein
MDVDGVITVKSKTSENRSHCNQEDCCPVHSLHSPSPQYFLTSGGTQDPMTHDPSVTRSPCGCGGIGQYPVNLVPGHASVIQYDGTTAPRSQMACIELYCSRVGAGVGPLDPCSALLCSLGPHYSRGKLFGSTPLNPSLPYHRRN